MGKFLGKKYDGIGRFRVFREIDRSGYRVIDGRKPLAKLAGTGHRGQLFGNGDAEHRTPWADVGRADVGIKSRRNGRRKGRDGISRNGRRKSGMASRIGCTFTMPVGESVSMIQSQLLGQGEQT